MARCFPAWHQDGSFLGEQVRAFNLWISLTRCRHDAEDTPGLDVVPRRIGELLETGGEDTWIDNSVSPQLVEERYGDEISRPNFEPGDALFFDDRFLHKTAADPGMTRRRRTIETWFFAPSTFPDGYEPLAV
ncbi:MAG: hypothetical protein U5R31_17320 [Acidimicrobiia bacterium]|nr:hypothetical protein [Acidimicrobiia bacterium]